MPGDCVYVSKGYVCMPGDCVCMPGDCVYMSGDCVCMPGDCVCMPGDYVHVWRLCVHVWGLCMHILELHMCMPRNVCTCLRGCVYTSGWFPVGRKSHILHVSNVGLCLDQSWGLDTAILSWFLCPQLLTQSTHNLPGPGTCLCSMLPRHLRRSPGVAVKAFARVYLSGYSAMGPFLLGAG